MLIRKGAQGRVGPDNARPGPDCLMQKFNVNPPEEIDVIRFMNMDNFTELNWL